MANRTAVKGMKTEGALHVEGAWLPDVLTARERGVTCLPCFEMSQQGGALDGTDFAALVEYDDTNRLRIERRLRGQEARSASDAGKVHILCTTGPENYCQRAGVLSSAAHVRFGTGGAACVSKAA